MDVLILSNGPGEITTWIRPVVRELREKLGYDRSQLRISIVLSPCSNATGKEAEVALSYPEVDRVQDATHFFPFLLWGSTFENWEWRNRGVVLFLGGDQIFPLVISKRLGYRSVIYAEWSARWYRWLDCFGVMKSEIISQVPTQYQHKFTVVGDLMAEASATGKERENQPNSEAIIGLLPGSKAGKLTPGVPFCLAIAQYIHTKNPQTRFVIPVAPTLDLPTLASYANRKHNRLIDEVWGVGARLVTNNELSYLETSSGLRIELITHFPAYDTLSQCHLCLTTVGANTAELGALAVPMIILIPTQKMDTMRSWDGLPGILANLPGIGSLFAIAINRLALRNLGLRAWPNIWAGREIVPELVGDLQAAEVGDLVLDWLNHPEKLAVIEHNLRCVRGESGAAQKLVQLVAKQLNY